MSRDDSGQQRQQQGKVVEIKEERMDDDGIEETLEDVLGADLEEDASRHEGEEGAEAEGASGNGTEDSSFDLSKLTEFAGALSAFDADNRVARRVTTDDDIDDDAYHAFSPDRYRNPDDTSHYRATHRRVTPDPFRDADNVTHRDDDEVDKAFSHRNDTVDAVVSSRTGRRDFLFKTSPTLKRHSSTFSCGILSSNRRMTTKTTVAAAAAAAAVQKLARAPAKKENSEKNLVSPASLSHPPLTRRPLLPDAEIVYRTRNLDSRRPPVYGKTGGGVGDSGGGDGDDDRSQ